MKKINQFIMTEKLLGSGAFSQVFQGYFEENPSQLVAVKQICKDNTSQQVIKWVVRESELLTSLKHQHIVQMHCSVQTAKHIYIILQYCDGGDLEQLLAKRPEHRLLETEATSFIRQICQGFKYLYAQGVIHRDIKPANIMIHEGKTLIADFGFARCIDKIRMEQKNFLSMNGSPLYVSPQILDNVEYSSKCDIWSLGIVLFEMLYGDAPWTGCSTTDLLNNIKNQPVLNFPDSPVVSSPVKDLIRRMLQVKEEDRISWPELLAHPLVVVDLNQIMQEHDTIKRQPIQDGQDNLQKSWEANDFYVRNAKILDLDKIGHAKEETAAIKPLRFALAAETELEEEEETSCKSTPRCAEENVDIQQITKIQTERLEQRQSEIKIDKRLIFQRNLNIFANLTINLIFMLHRAGAFSLPLDVFYRVLYILQKYQKKQYERILRFYHQANRRSLMLDSYPQEIILSYLQSKDWQITRQIVNNDYQLLQLYCSEIKQYTLGSVNVKMESSKRVLEFLDQISKREEQAELKEQEERGHEEQLEENISQTVESEVNEEAEDTELFKTLEQSASEFLHIAKYYAMNESNPKQKQLLQMLIYLSLLRDPRGLMQRNADNQQFFHHLYSKVDNFSISELQTELSSLLVTVGK